MRPILLELPWLGLRVHAYGLGMFLACVSALAVTVWRARKEGIRTDAVYEMATWLFLGGVIGARALFAVVHPELIRHPADLVRVWEGGNVFYGCIMGGLAGTLIYYRRHPFPFARMADAVAPALAIGVFFGRIGCYFNGCCFGGITDSALCLRFPAGSHAWTTHVNAGLISPESAWSLPVHPTQLYASAAGLILLAVLLGYTPFRRRPGQVMAVLMMAYPITRWPIEVMRADDAGLFLGVTVSQLVSLGLFAGGVYVWHRLGREEVASPELMPIRGRTALATDS